VVEFKDGPIYETHQRALSDVYSSMRIADHANIYAAATFLVTIAAEHINRSR